MPKVVSRSAVSSSTDGELNEFIVITTNHILQLSRQRPQLLLYACIVRLRTRTEWDRHAHLALDCICGEFIVCLSLKKKLVSCWFGFFIQLVIDKGLASLPRRQTDNAIIIRTQDSNTGKARMFKLNATASDPILLERWINFVFGTIVTEHL